MLSSLARTRHNEWILFLYANSLFNCCHLLLPLWLSSRQATPPLTRYSSSMPNHAWYFVEQDKWFPFNLFSLLFLECKWLAKGFSWINYRLNCNIFLANWGNFATERARERVWEWGGGWERALTNVGRANLELQSGRYGRAEFIVILSNVSAGTQSEI